MKTQRDKTWDEQFEEAVREDSEIIRAGIIKALTKKSPLHKTAMRKHCENVPYDTFTSVFEKCLDDGTIVPAPQIYTSVPLYRLANKPSVARSLRVTRPEPNMEELRVLTARLLDAVTHLEVEQLNKKLLDVQTGWHEACQKPVRVGVYKLENTDGPIPFYSYWSGNCWMFITSSTGLGIRGAYEKRHSLSHMGQEHRWAGITVQYPNL